MVVCGSCGWSTSARGTADIADFECLWSWVLCLQHSSVFDACRALERWLPTSRALMSLHA